MKTIQINNKHYQEFDVVMLPTDKSSKLVLNNKKELWFNTDISCKSGLAHPQHLYILSNDEIKEGDWFHLDMSDNRPNPDEIHQMGNDNKSKTGGINFSNNSAWSKCCKKVIATTDSSLIIKDNCDCLATTFEGCSQCIERIPQIPQSFIEQFITEYNKDNVINKVLVKVVDNGEEDWIGDDYNGEPFWNEKWEIKLNQNNEIFIVIESEQETLEEAAEIFGKNYADVPLESKELAGAVFYVVSGHGGPDPGAMANVSGKQICEDEYAYDIALRLGRNLLKKGAIVHFITQDKDGKIGRAHV
jgi:N-acetylmuramoyl-L-alanine amidase